jgi:hypothetical protein
VSEVAIRGERLTTWTVSAEGERVLLGFEDEAGHPVAISLPLEALSALMMTIPRMLHEALAGRCTGGALRLRMIHPLGDWRVERAMGADASLLSLATPDGFEVTFSLATPEADRLGERLRYSAEVAAMHPPAVN